MPGPPMSLWGEMNTASLSSPAASSPGGSISMATYGAAAAKSQNDSAPCRWSSTRDRARVGHDAGHVRRGREASRCAAAGRRTRRARARAGRGRCGRPRPRGWSRRRRCDSRHGSSLRVVLVGADEHDRPLLGRDARRAGRSARRAPPGGAGRARRRACGSPPSSPSRRRSPRAASGRRRSPRATRRRASSRKRVVWRPVPDDSVWVFA